MTSSTDTNSARLRRVLRERRNLQPARAAHRASRVITARLWRLPAIRTARRIACYLPISGEVDTWPLITALWRDGRTPYLPCITPHGLLFRPFGPHTRLQPNRYGIDEPVHSDGRACNARHMDVVLAPLVGFDAEGNRLGMGGGYYDRTLAFLRRQRVLRKPLFIGVAYAFQQVEVLGTSEWDVPLHGVVTEKSARRFPLQVLLHRRSTPAPSHPGC